MRMGVIWWGYGSLRYPLETPINFVPQPREWGPRAADCYCRHSPPGSAFSPSPLAGVHTHPHRHRGRELSRIQAFRRRGLKNLAMLSRLSPFCSLVIRVISQIPRRLDFLWLRDWRSLSPVIIPQVNCRNLPGTLEVANIGGFLSTIGVAVASDTFTEQFLRTTKQQP